MELVSALILGSWFFGAFMGTLTLFGCFAGRELAQRKSVWVLGSLLCATWVGLLVVVIVVWLEGWMVSETQLMKLLGDRDRKIIEIEKEKSQLVGLVEKLRSDPNIKDLSEENKRLLKLKNTAELESKQLRSRVESLEARLQELTRRKTATAPATEVPPPVTLRPGRTPDVPVRTAKHQEFPKFRVEVMRLFVGTGNEVEVLLTYINKTQQELELMLIGAAMGRTFVTDNVGNRYKYRSSSGLSGDMYESYMNGTPMTLAPGARATASFSFVPSQSMGSKATSFSFISEQALVRPTVDKFHSWKTARVETQFNLTIQDIEPR